MKVKKAIQKKISSKKDARAIQKKSGVAQSKSSVAQSRYGVAQPELLVDGKPSKKIRIVQSSAKVGRISRSEARAAIKIINKSSNG